MLFYLKNSEVPAVMLVQGKMSRTLKYTGIGKQSNPLDGCHNYRAISQSGHDFYFVSNSDQCPISQKIHFAQQANAKALIIGHDNDTLSEIKEIGQFPGILS